MLDNLLMDIGEKFLNLWESSGLAKGDWQNYVMILVSFVLMYLAIVKKFEPLLLLPIAFGMFIINIPGAQNIVWGRYETPDTSLQIGVNSDGTLEYAGVYLQNATGALVYVRDGFLSGNVLTFFADFPLWSRASSRSDLLSEAPVAAESMTLPPWGWRVVLLQ